MKKNKIFYGNRLRFIRLLKYQTTSDMATILEVSKQYISKIELGNLIPSEPMIIGICKIYKLPDNFFESELVQFIFEKNDITFHSLKKQEIKKL